jgi:hypothetical protein
MRRETASGILLIAGSLLTMSVMFLHPTSHDLLAPGNFARQAHRNTLVHGAAIAAIPMLFLGLLGLSRRLGFDDLSVAATVSYGLGAIAVFGAAVASGFVATEAIGRMIEVGEDASGMYHALLASTGWWNQAFATVGVGASATAILLWSAAILRSSRVPRLFGVAGAVIGGAILLAFLSGHLRLNIHGFGIVVLAESLWFIGVGALLIRESESGSTRKS